MRRPFWFLLVVLGLLPGWLLGQTDSAVAGSDHEHVVRPLEIFRTQYHLRAGERVRIDVPGKTADFIHSAKRRTALAGLQRAFAIGPNVAGDQVLLGVPLATPPGEYSVTISATGELGEERTATISVTVDALPTVPANSTTPPVVLLDGWQGSLTSSCPMSTDSSENFDNLEEYLRTPPTTSGYAASQVYFFENCTECPNCAIEQLGAYLATFLDSIVYSNGAPVSQVDLIAHSMGGLIVRSYLSGQQISGAFSPPGMPKIRKSVFIATPHFGSFQADSAIADILFALGNQTNEMKRGSGFLWDLATWNQFGDDLRGTDALAIIGNAGPYENLAGASDGVVELTSASLDFAKLGRTTIVPYCHLPSTSFGGLAGFYTGCNEPGIAFVDSPSHQTYQIVSSFLANSATWQSVGTVPAQDPYLSKYGGMVVADLNSSDQYVSPSSVSWGGSALTSGAAGYLYYADMVSGTGNFSFGSSTCGPYTQAAGMYSAVRCKLAPTVYSVGPLLSGAGRVVQAGTITITGLGFGAQQCSSCKVVVTPPGSTNGYSLPVSSWSDQAISVSFMPTAMPNLTIPGLVTLYVELSSAAWDSVNLMAAAAPSSAIAAAPTSLQFAYTAGGTAPPSQSLQVTSSGGTLNWSATTSVSWLVVRPTSGAAPSTLSVLVSPTSLPAGTYTGSVQISAAGASNSPVSVAVTLTVAPAAAGLAVSPQALTFNYTAGGTVPAAQNVSITNTGGGTLSWIASASAAWLGLSSTSGTAPAAVSVLVNPASLAAGSYSATVLIAATGSTGTVSLPITLVVQGQLSTVNIAAVSNGASFQAGFASATWLSIVGTNLSQTTRAWQNSDFVNGLLPESLSGVSVTINGLLAYVEYVSPTQLNVLAPDDATVGAVQVQVTTAQGKSNSFTAQKQQFAPAFFWMPGGAYVAALHADYTYVGKAGLIAGVTSTPATPGETILIYATGFGPTNPAFPSAQLVTAPAVLANTVQVTIGGVAASVTYAGLVGAGLYQINVTVPTLANGDAAVVAQIGGVQTQPGVSITIQQ